VPSVDRFCNLIFCGAGESGWRSAVEAA